MTRKLSPVFVLSTLFLFIQACNLKTDNKYTAPSDFPYSLDQPDEVFNLDNDLQEISGLSYLSNNKLACVQDEQGVLYIFDLEKKGIAEDLKFGTAGDYEGVEVVGDTVYAIKSNGTIQYFSLQAPKLNVLTLETPFKSNNDVEGLGFNPTNQSLLIVCKEKGEVENNGVVGKAIYSLPLKEKKLEETPFVVLDETLVEKYSKESKFKPSAIAVHPKTGEIFLLSSADRSLVVLKDKNIKHFIFLDPKQFEQPEGICFSPDGTLFISNEGGKDGDGNILKFNYK